jgi:hypothetical protein
MYLRTVSRDWWRDWRMIESSGTPLRYAWVQNPARREWVLGINGTENRHKVTRHLPGGPQATVPRSAASR